MFVRAECKEIVLTKAQRHSALHGIYIQCLGHRGSVESAEYIGGRGIPDTVAICFFRSGQTGVEPLRSIVYGQDSDIFRQSVAQLGQEPFPVIGRGGEGGNLSCGMDSGIGTPTTVDLDILTEDVR